MFGIICRVTVGMKNCTMIAQSFLKSHPLQACNIQISKPHSIPSLRTNAVSYSYSEYMEKMLPKVEGEVRPLIMSILSNNSKTPESRKHILTEMEGYLLFKKFTFSQKRTVQGLALLLISMYDSKLPYLETYHGRIADFLIKSQKFDRLDSRMLEATIRIINERTKNYIQKNRKMFYHIKLNDLIVKNQEKISDKVIKDLTFYILFTNSQNTHNNVILARVSRTFLVIQKRVTLLLDRYLSSTNPSQLRDISYLCNSSFIQSYSTLLKIFNFTDGKEAQTFSTYLIQMYEKKKDFKADLKALVRVINCMPMQYISKEEDVTVLDRFITFLERELKKKSSHSEFLHFQQYIHQLLITNIVKQTYYRHYLRLNFKKVNDMVVLGKDTIIQRPQFADFFWQLFKDVEKRIADNPFIHDLFLNIYPERFKLHNVQVVYRQSVGYLENETSFKLMNAMKKLGLSFEKEVQVVHRSIDFLVEGNIIVEMDGESHFDAQTGEITPKTAYRNYHMLLRGYRLIVISIFEYNYHRDTDSLVKLLEKKLKLVREGAVFVQ